MRTAPQLECKVGQVWCRRGTHVRLEIRRLAGRSAFGALTIAGIELCADGQVLYTQLAARWERES